MDTQVREERFIKLSGALALALTAVAWWFQPQTHKNWVERVNVLKSILEAQDHLSQADALTDAQIYSLMRQFGSSEAEVKYLIRQIGGR